MNFSDITLHNVKGVLIDLDNTLYKYQPAHNKAIEYCYGQFNKDFPNIIKSFEEFNKSYRLKRDGVTKRLSPQGACRSRLFAFQTFFEELNFNCSFIYALRYEQIYWQEFINNIYIDPTALEFLHTCRNLNIPVCMVSDMQANFQVLKIEKLKIENLIKYLVTSEEVGAEKPNSIIFEYALSKLKLTAKDVIMIGDDETKDIKGATILGIKAYRITLS